MRTRTIDRRRVLDPRAFPMQGYACTKCDFFATLEENAKDHIRKTQHPVPRVMLRVTAEPPPKPITCTGFMQLVLSKYKDKPDDYALSIGHWEPRPSIIGVDIPEFCAFMRLTVGELKEMLKDTAPAPWLGEIFACPKCDMTSGNDWSQCRGSCPMPMSPHFNPEERTTWKT